MNGETFPYTRDILTNESDKEPAFKKMSTYYITAPETYLVEYKIEADNPKEAVEEFERGGGTPVDEPHFVSVDDYKNWTIEEETKEGTSTVKKPGASLPDEINPHMKTA